LVGRSTLCPKLYEKFPLYNIIQLNKKHTHPETR
jgi:hypothetical protein